MVVDKQPITATAAAPTIASSQANVVVRAPFVNVDVVKTGGLVSVNTGELNKSLKRIGICE